MKKTILYAFLTAAVYLGTVSCERTDIIGGSVNNTDSLDISTYELLASNEESAVVAEPERLYPRREHLRRRYCPAA